MESIRNPNGYGSVTKLGGKRRKPYLARGGAVYDSDGNEHRPNLGTFRTAAEAYDAINSFSKAPTTKINYTLEDLWEEFITTRRYLKISQSLKDNYKASWNKRLSVLKKSLVKNIRTSDFQKLIDKEIEKGSSYSLIHKDRTLMSLLMKLAMEHDIILKNYADYITMPPNEDNTKEPFSREELEIIEAAIPHVKYTDCIFMLCYTGHRINEFLKFTSEDYDEKENVLVGGSKTKAGKKRVVPIHPKIKKYFNEWLDKKGERIICRPDGTPFTERYFREKCFYTAIEQINEWHSKNNPESSFKVRKLTPHSTRHTFATLCEEAGIDKLHIQLLLGHTNYQQTKKYTHVEVLRLIDSIQKIS